MGDLLQQRKKVRIVGNHQMKRLRCWASFFLRSTGWELNISCRHENIDSKRLYRKWLWTWKHDFTTILSFIGSIHKFFNIVLGYRGVFWMDFLYSFAIPNVGCNKMGYNHFQELWKSQSKSLMPSKSIEVLHQRHTTTLHPGLYPLDKEVLCHVRQASVKGLFRVPA